MDPQPIPSPNLSCPTWPPGHQTPTITELPSHHTESPSSTGHLCNVAVRWDMVGPPGKQPQPQQHSSPVILTGGQIPNVLFNEEVGLWHKIAKTSGCLRGVARAGPLPQPPLSPWPCPSAVSNLGSAVSPPLWQALRWPYSPSCPQWPSCAAALSASAYPAGQLRTAIKHQGPS